jgi:hypothetical protein
MGKPQMKPLERWLIVGTVVLVLGALAAINREVITIVAVCMFVGLAAFETTRQLRRPYGRAIEDAFGFAFVPELDRRGKDAAPGSALRQAYDAMVEAKKSATIGIRPEHGSDNENPGPKYRPTPLSGGDRKALAKEMTKARAMPLPDDALKIVTRGTEKDDRAAA